MGSTFDLAPFRRSTVGFDRLFSVLETEPRGDDRFPPFDILKEGENSYRITLAIAGFRADDIEIVAEENQIVVVGRRPDLAEKVQVLHRGIITKSFECRFQLADCVEVGEARFENGLLSIALRRFVPEAMQPRKIAIGTQAAGQPIRERSGRQSQPGPVARGRHRRSAPSQARKGETHHGSS